MSSLLLLAFLDIVIVYLMTFGLLEETFQLLPRTKTKAVEFVETYLPGVIAAILLGLIAYYLGGNVYRVASVIVGVMIIKIVSKRSYHTSASIYVIYFIAGIVIQGVIMILFQVLGFNPMVFYIGVQAVSAVTFFIIYVSKQLHSLRSFVETNLVAKFIFFLITVFASAVLFMINFEYELYHVLYFLVIIIGVLIALIQVATQIKKNHQDMIDNHRIIDHAVGHILARHEVGKLDIDRLELVRELQDAVEATGRNAYKGLKDPASPNKLQDLVDKAEDFLSNMEIISSIRYNEDHYRIPFTVIYNMFELLLNIATSNWNHLPIITKLAVDEYYGYLMVEWAANEKGHQAFLTQYKKILSHVDNQDVHQLKKLVKRQKGKIKINFGHHPEYKAHYTTVVVRFVKFIK